MKSIKTSTRDRYSWEGAREVPDLWAIMKNCLERLALAAKWVGALSTDIFQKLASADGGGRALSGDPKWGRSAER